jgi:hypothetical protein
MAKKKEKTTVELQELMMAAEDESEGVAQRFGKSETIIKEMIDGKRKTEPMYIATLREVAKNVR